MVTGQDIEIARRRWLVAIGTKHEEARLQIFRGLVDQANREHAAKAVRA